MPDKIALRGMFVATIAVLGLPRLWRRAAFRYRLELSRLSWNAIEPRLTIGDLQATLTHYLGGATTSRALETFIASRGCVLDPSSYADARDIRFAESLMASAIGSASSRLVVSLLLKRQRMSGVEVLRLVDDVSVEIHGHRILQHQANSRMQQGMAFYDRDLRLVAWSQCGEETGLFPDTMLRAGVTLQALLRHCAEKGLYGPGPVEEVVATRLAAMLDTDTIKRTRTAKGRVYDLRTVRLADGALFAMYMDVTAQTASEDQLEAENETLERRVRERTEQLEHLNAALVKAKAEAEEANVSKTRFLAAASHDLLQPLNAARLYATSLKERIAASPVAVGESLTLASNVEASLESVEDILTALLDISHLDAGATTTEISVFRVDDIFRQLRLEFAPMARAKGLSLRFVASALPISSDWRLIRRLVQNLVSNALKYTVEGRVIVGVRRRGASVSIQVWDTGLGIPPSNQRDIFREFERLPDAVMTAHGVGLGLSIVERLGRVLDHAVELRSEPGRGSVFSVMVPRAPVTASPRVITSGQAAQNPGILDGLVVVAIDNETSILSGMEALLGGWRCAVVTGVDLASATATLAARGLVPDVIVADYHLGESDGIATIQALRAWFGPCHAVIITADQSPVVRDLAQASDVILLNKPVKPAALRALLSRWCLVNKGAA